MTRLRKLAALLLALSALALSAGAAHSDTGIAGHYIVVLKDDADARSVAAAHARDHGAKVRFVYTAALEGYAATLTPGALQAVKRDPRVLFVDQDREVTATAQSLPTGINRIDGEVSSARSGDGTGTVNANVAVIDTGIDTSHTDLTVAGGTDCTGSGTYNDGNGHGTHVAGTIAAKDNASGVVGVAPGARLWAVRVLNSAGSGTTSQVICGINWVAANGPSLGIKVANMSLGGGGSDDSNCGNTNGDAEHVAICNATSKGILFVVAAGNSGVNFSTSVPAAYNEVLTVTAMADFDGQPGGAGAATCRFEYDDSYASFSNYAVLSSDKAHTIAAPGVCIYSSWKGNSYNTISGTSMASPHVAGTAALCISTGACAGTPSQVMSKLRNDASSYNQGHISYGFYGDPIEPVGSRYYGYLLRAGSY